MSQFDDLAIVKKANDLRDRGVSTQDVRVALIKSNTADILVWFERYGVTELLAQVDSRRRTARRESSWERPIEYDEDNLQKPLVEIPPVVNRDGETLPSKLTRDYADSAAVRWAKTTAWEGRYLWDAADDIDWLLEMVDKNRRTADGIRKTTDLIEGLVEDIKAGVSKDDALATLREGWHRGQ